MKAYIVVFIFAFLMLVGCRDKHQDDEHENLPHVYNVSITTEKVFAIIYDDNADELVKMIKSKQISSRMIPETVYNISIFNLALQFRKQRCIEAIWQLGGAENRDDPYQTWKTLYNLFNVADDSLRERILTDLLMSSIDFEMQSPFGTQRTIIEELEYKKDEIVEFRIPLEVFNTYIQQLQEMTERCKRFKENQNMSGRRLDAQREKQKDEESAK